MLDLPPAVAGPAGLDARSFVSGKTATRGAVLVEAAAYVYVLAADAVAIDSWLQTRPGRLRNLVLAAAVLTFGDPAVSAPGAPARRRRPDRLQGEPEHARHHRLAHLVRTVDVVSTSLGR